MPQSTIARRIACRGTGLHSGEPVALALAPAPAESGIVFVLQGAGEQGADVEVPARPDAVRSTSRATTLGLPRRPVGDDAAEPPLARITTVEHLLAALYALEIDNVRVEVSGPEIPVLDGSAAPFVDWVRSAGRQRQPAPRRVLAVDEPLEVRDGDRWIRIEPAEDLHVSYAIDFPHPCIGRQTLEIGPFDLASFERELAGARTFGFAHEVEALREAGLARGGSFDNTVLLDDEKVLNPGGLHWPDEFVRHKMIDLIGDLALLGAKLSAHIRVEKGGHGLHLGLVRALAEREGQRLEPPSRAASVAAG